MRNQRLREVSWLRDLGPGAKTSRLGTSPPLADILCTSWSWGWAFTFKASRVPRAATKIPLMAHEHPGEADIPGYWPTASASLAAAQCTSMEPSGFQGTAFEN